MTKQEQRRIKNLQRKMLNIFRLSLIIPTALWLFICFISLLFPGIKKAIDYDLGENRYLASFPTNFSSDWFSDLETYYNDHVPFRSLLIDANKSLKYAAEIPYDNGIRDIFVAIFHGAADSGTPITETSTTMNIDDIFGTSASIIPSTTTPNETIPSDSSQELSSLDIESTTVAETTIPVTEPPAPLHSLPEPPTEAVEPGFLAPVLSNNSTIIGRNRWLFLAGSNLDYYLANNILSEDKMQQYADKLNELKTVLDQHNKRMVILLVPEKPQIYPEYMPNYEVEETYKRSERLTDYLQTHTEIPICFPIHEITALKNYLLLYKKYDSHWNNAGSFIGYQMILKMLGLPTTNVLDLDIEMYPIGSGAGDLINSGALNLSDYSNDYDYTIHYKDYIGLLGTEGEVFRSDIYYRAFSTAENQDKVAVIGDSFRNHMVLYMCKDFADSSILHFFELGDDKVNPVLLNADTIVLTIAERNDYRIFEISDFLINLYSN